MRKSKLCILNSTEMYTFIQILITLNAFQGHRDIRKMAVNIVFLQSSHFDFVFSPLLSTWLWTSDNWCIFFLSESLRVGTVSYMCAGSFKLCMFLTTIKLEMVMPVWMICGLISRLYESLEQEHAHFPVWNASCGMEMSPVHQVWPKPSCKAQWKREEDKAEEVGRQHQGMVRLGVRQRVVENREKWRKLVVKPSVVPLDPCS